MATWEAPGEQFVAGSGEGGSEGTARPAPWRPAGTPPPLAAEIADPDPRHEADDELGREDDEELGADQTPTLEAVGAPRRSAALPSSSGQPTRPDVVLVEESRQQSDQAAPAEDLFTGEVFVRARTYARATGAPWFVLSAEYGLLSPDQVVGPYERSMATVSTAYREAWGPWVLARLETLAGPLRRLRIEVHAVSLAASEGVRRQLLGSGAVVLEPLRGLSAPDRIAWYDQLSGAGPRALAGSGSSGDQDAARLGDAAGAVRPSALLASVDATLRGPGLYSWFVDEAGARQLSAGLSAHVAPGLVWVGQAGAVRPGSGLTSTTTLRNQLAWVHLGSSVRLSPLRRILGAALFRAAEAGVATEAALTDWMHEHLAVVTVGSDAPERLIERAEALSGRLAPQLSPEHASDQQLRTALVEARNRFEVFPTR